MYALGIPDQYIMQRGDRNSDGILNAVYRNTMDDYIERLFWEIIGQHSRSANLPDTMHTFFVFRIQLAS